MTDTHFELATFGGGCFWCTEAIMQELNGVHEVTSGYAGGEAPAPTYHAVCSGTTGHAEVVQVRFDPEVITYRDLITVFMTTPDPTQVNQQGADVGTQYRSIILYHSEAQRETAEAVLDELASYYDLPIATQLVELEKFHPAERYHQDYYRNNGSNQYCAFVINPKLQKFRRQHSEKLQSRLQ